jgi:hypothetical protein
MLHRVLHHARAAGEWLIDDEQRVSVIKSELGRRGVFDGQ